MRSAQELVFESEGEPTDLSLSRGVPVPPPHPAIEEIDSQAIDAFSAFNYFHAKSAAATLSTRERGEGEGAVRRALESPQERLLRLKLELAELEQDLSAMDLAEQRDTQSVWSLLQSETKSLAARAGALPVRFPTQFSDTEDEKRERETAHGAVLEEIQRRLSTSLSLPVAASTTADTLPGDGAALLSLERRVHRLETALGVHCNALAHSLADDLSPSLLAVYPLVRIVGQLEQRVSLCDAHTLDALRTKFIALKNEISSSLDHHSKNSDNSLAKALDALQKLDSLSQNVHKLDSVAEELPVILTRLKTLESVHWHASMFAQRLQEMEKDVRAVSQEVQSNGDVLREVKDGLRENLQAMDQSMRQVEARLARANV